MTYPRMESDTAFLIDLSDRLNYILWLQDLIDTTGGDYRDRDDYDPDREVVGLDM
jgi:23S rRNA (adenine1618-N6)-methyltransferase